MPKVLQQKRRGKSFVIPNASKQALNIFSLSSKGSTSQLPNKKTDVQILNFNWEIATNKCVGFNVLSN